MANKGNKVALCVAEKPSVAKSIAELLSQGKFNKVSKICLNVGRKIIEL